MKILFLLTLLFGANIAIANPAAEAAKTQDEDVAVMEAAAEPAAKPAVRPAVQPAEQAQPTLDVPGPDATKPEWLAKIIGIAVGIQFLLWGLATGLTKIAVWTENETDNKIAAALGQVSWMLGSFLGRFGYSVPKEVMRDMAEKDAAKTAAAKDA